MAIWRAGAVIALRTISMPVLSSSFAGRNRPSTLAARSSGTPPPGRMPSSTAARVACSASSTRSLRSFTPASGRAPAADPRDPPGEFGEPLLQLLAVVVGGGLLDLRLDLPDPALDLGLLARAVDDRGVLLLDHHLLGAAEKVMIEKENTTIVNG